MFSHLMGSLLRVLAERLQEFQLIPGTRVGGSVSFVPVWGPVL